MQMICSRVEESEVELESFLPETGVQQVAAEGATPVRQELRPVVRDPRYETKPSRMVLAGKMCPYDHRCLFRHNLTEEEKRLQ
ncbi:hypothetical protein EJ110_NYTH48226 [Nymphaea thermarum]|nr:hypothetical protein EJ110_NYTH48226 [Nymphaea thermarum]